MRNQEFFPAGRGSWNEGTSMNILSVVHQRKTVQGKTLKFVLLAFLEIAFQMKHLTHRRTQPGHFFLK